MTNDERTDPSDEVQGVSLTLGFDPVTGRPNEDHSLICLLTKETGQASWTSALDEHKRKTLAVFAQLQTSFLNSHETLKKVGGALSSARNTDSAPSQNRTYGLEDKVRTERIRTRQPSKGPRVVVRKVNAKQDASTNHINDETPDEVDDASLDSCRDFQHRHCMRNNCKFAHRRR